MQALCRDCGAAVRDEMERCPGCQSPRLVRHVELNQLAIAHVDCDAFYASVEKRDNPEWADKPVIVGGGQRGVVTAACYHARIFGVRSAMPMYKALKACPDAVVVKPNMSRYVAVGRQIRELMRELTPLVEPLSIDEAFLDLNGTERLHGKPPACLLIELIVRIEREVGVTASVGLSHNKFLAKVASDMDKPRGFAIIGRTETSDVLAPMPISTIWGVGPKLGARLNHDGLKSIADLRRLPLETLVARYGDIGQRLFYLARGEDRRSVKARQEAKSISAETTFNTDIAEFGDLRGRLWRLCEKISDRMKSQRVAGSTVTLKLKTAQFQILTRSRKLGRSTQLAEVLFQVGEAALVTMVDRGPVSPDWDRCH